MYHFGGSISFGCSPGVPGSSSSPAGSRRKQAVSLTDNLKGICHGVLTLITAIALFIKKHPAADLILLLPGILSVPLAANASRLFIDWGRWEPLLLYVVSDAALLLCVAGFGMIAVWAMNGFAFPKGKKLVASIFICLTAAALPHEIMLMIINAVIYDGLRPVYSVTLSAFSLMLVILIALLLTL